MAWLKGQQRSAARLCLGQGPNLQVTHAGGSPSSRGLSDGVVCCLLQLSIVKAGRHACMQRPESSVSVQD